MAEFLSADEAVARIPDGATLGMTGILMCGVAEEVAAAIERAFRDRGHPRDLTLVHASGIGNWHEGGVAHLGHEGLVTKWIGGHTGVAPAMAHLIEDNHCQAYCIPQGVGAQLYRETAAHRPGVITHVGIGTFIDPRLGGGRMNQATTVDYVKVIEIEGQEYLLYPSFPIDVAVIRGTTADELGNVTLDEEAVILGQLPMAQAAKNSGGIVIAQATKTIVYCGSFTAGGLEVATGDGRLRVTKEGKFKKFVSAVEEITFSGAEAARRGQRILYVTERAVFELHEGRMTLTELAPGIDLERDVLAQMEFTPVVAEPLAPMPGHLFYEKWGKLRSIITASPQAATPPRASRERPSRPDVPADASAPTE